MESYVKHKDAGAKDPDFGAIFMTSSATLQECFQRRLFGLPPRYMPFVKQVKAGMLLFLFEYDKRELYGVYKSCCDGAMNIVPSAFRSSGRQFPAQVEFSPIWDCKPLRESTFRDAIRENYYTPKKFCFGLSETQVRRLLDLFSKRKLPEHYPVGKVGRSVGGCMHAEIVKNEQDAVASTLPLTMMHNYQRDSFHYTGEVDDEEHSIGTQFGPAISGGLSGNFRGVVTVHDDRSRERLLSKHNTKPGQRYFDDSTSLHNSRVGSLFFSSKPVLGPDSLVQNQLAATSAMPHPIQALISDNFCIAQGNLSSKSSLLYDLDAPGSNIRQPSSVRIRINDSSKPMGESASPSNNYRRSILRSVDVQPSCIHAELKDTNRSQDWSHGLNNPVSFESNVASVTLGAAQNLDQLATKPFEYEGLDCSPFKSSSGLLPHLGIGNSGWGSEPYSSLCDKYNTHLSDDYCSKALQENLGYDEMTLQNNETYSAMPWEDEDHSQIQYGDLSCHEHDPNFECYAKSGRSYSSSKNKDSVFSRLSYVHPSNNKKYGRNHSQGGYDACSLNSVDKVMDMVRQSCNQQGMKRKINPWVNLNKDESLRDRKIRSSGSTKISSRKSKDDTGMGSMIDAVDSDRKIRSSRSTKASSGKSLDDTGMDIMIDAVDCETNQIDEGTCFVDFKRRSQVRRNNETRIRGSDESVRVSVGSGDLQTVQQKRRKLIRPNFSKSTTPDGKKDINLGPSQNLQVPSSLGNLKPKDDSKSCEGVIQTEENLKIDGKELTLNCQKHFKGKSDHTRGVNSEGGNPREGLSIPKIGLNDESECPEHRYCQNASSSAFCEARSFKDKEGLCVKDDKKPIFPDTEIRHSICQAHKEEKVVGPSGYINIRGRTLQDGKQLLPTEVQDVPESEKNSGNEDATNLTCEKNNCDIEKGSNIGEGTLQDGKQVLPTEVQDAPKSEKNSGDEDVSNLTCEKSNRDIEKDPNIREGTLQDGKQLLPTEVQDVPESEKNFGNGDVSNLTCEKSNCNIEKGSNMNNESQEASGLAESSELCEDTFKKKKGASFHD